MSTLPLSSFLTGRPGIDQGRVELGTAPEGDAAFVLGSLEGGHEDRAFEVGDYYHVRQTADLTLTNPTILRFRGRVRGPSRMPAVSAAEPTGPAGYALADGQTLILAIDDGAQQTITFSTGDFANIAEARAWEVRDAINAQLTGAVARLNGLGISIYSDTKGRGSRVEVVGGTAAALDFKEWAWEFRVSQSGAVLYRLELVPGRDYPLEDIAVRAVVTVSTQLVFLIQVVEK